MEDFKIGCEILAGFAQSFWDSLNVFEQIVAVVAGVIGAALVLGCTGGFIAGCIGRWRRARREHRELAGDVRYARIMRMQYDPIAEYGGECHVEKDGPAIFFPVLLQADALLENYQRAYQREEEE